MITVAELSIPRSQPFERTAEQIRSELKLPGCQLRFIFCGKALKATGTLEDTPQLLSENTPVIHVFVVPAAPQTANSFSTTGGNRGSTNQQSSELSDPGSLFLYVATGAFLGGLWYWRWCRPEAFNAFGFLILSVITCLYTIRLTQAGSPRTASSAITSPTSSPATQS